jgi:GT2 family glycosyltransferase
MPESKRFSLSVLIPVFAGGKAFRRCLDSILENQPAPDEVIVVADGDGDGSWIYAQERGVQVVSTGINRGPAAARNAGARAAKGDLLLFIDADIIAPANLSEQVVHEFENHPELAAVIGSYDDAPSDPGFVSQYRNLMHHYVHQQGNEEASTFWGACGGIRREAFWRAGGFDETYCQPSIEDIELGYRMKKMGLRIRLCKELHVKHLKRWTFASMVKTDFLYRALPWTELLLRERRLDNDLNLKTESRLSVLLAYGLLVTGMAGLLRGYFLLPAVGCALLLIWLNYGLYSFFKRIRGWSFAVRSVPLHWIYYLCGGAAFGLGLFRRGLGFGPDQRNW